MSTSIAESNQKSLKRNQELAQFGIPVSRDPGHLDYLLQIAPKTTYGQNALTSQAQIDFDLKYSPSYYLKDNRSIILAIKASETGGSASVKPSFVEAFFDRGTSFEWQCNSASIGSSHMMQTLLEPAIELSDNEYASLCNCLNHNSALTYTSPASISAGASQWFFVRVPNPFPKTGIWLGAMDSQTWTLKIKTQAGGAVDSGTGTLVLSDIQMILETVLVPETDFAELKRNWSKHHWIASSCAVNEPNPVTLTATGESPRIQLPQLRGLPVTAIYSFIHQSKAIAASAYFNFQALGNASK